MPVTAKLSRKFYEALGDDVANELVDWFNAVDATYRSDLHDLNELNFARFDAKLEQRAAEVDAKIDRLSAQVDAKIDQRAAELRVEIHDLRASLIRWMFGFWTATTLTMAGLAFAVVQLVRH